MSTRQAFSTGLVPCPRQRYLSRRSPKRLNLPQPAVELVPYRIYCRRARRAIAALAQQTASPQVNRSRNMRDFEQSLRNLTLAPYIVKAMALIGVKRRGGSNMFRHQLSTLAILLDYKIIDPVLLKAAVIHDLFEDAPTMPGVSEDEIKRVDADGPAVYDLVMEVTVRETDGIKEPKSDYLLRIMTTGSRRARLLK